MKGLKVLYNTLTIKLKDKPHSPGTDKNRKFRTICTILFLKQ